MAFTLSGISRRNLEGVHPQLIRVVHRALQRTQVDFRVIEGLRTPARQRQLFAAGATKTLNSRHLTGHAVDLAALIDGQVRWDWPLYHKIAEAMKSSAEEFGVRLQWGGDWRTFKDGPHFELKR